MKFLVCAALVVLVSHDAKAFCSEPSESIDFPDAPSSLLKPAVPYCLSSYKYSGKHTCDQWEISSYQSHIEDYIRKLQSYINDAAQAASEAANFATEAEEYARCEAKEVTSEIQ